MSDELKAGENLSKGLQRIARREMDRALKWLAKAETCDSQAVHEARKELKKIKAALRLVRPAIGRRLWRKENRELRKPARALAPVRDADALVKTLDQLRCCCRGTAAQAAFGRLRGVLLRQRRRVLRRGQKPFQEGRASLLAARRCMKDWPLKQFGWKEVCRGIRRTYKQGARAFRRVEARPLPEDMHEWRKRAKDLWCQLCVVKPIEQEKVGKLAAEMKQLGEYLGDAHDLVLLEAAAARAPLDAEDREIVGQIIQVRKAKLQHAALELGRKLYLQKPRAFAVQFKRYAKTWRR